MLKKVKDLPLYTSLTYKHLQISNRDNFKNCLCIFEQSDTNEEPHYAELILDEGKYLINEVLQHVRKYMSEEDFKKVYKELL